MHNTALLLIVPMIGALLMAALSSAAADTKVHYRCTFTRDGWNPADWQMVRRPDWDHYGKWKQGPDYLENVTPEGATPAELEARTDTHTSMVYRTPLRGDFTAASTMAFQYHMAPLITIAPSLADSPRPTHQQYQESYEVVLWNEGINVWHQWLQEGKVQWELIAYAKFPLQASMRYTLKVRKHGQTLEFTVGEHTFGVLLHKPWEQCYVGITGCEGSNRFYDFSLQQ